MTYGEHCEIASARRALAEQYIGRDVLRELSGHALSLGRCFLAEAIAHAWIKRMRERGAHIGQASIIDIRAVMLPRGTMQLTLNAEPFLL